MRKVCTIFFVMLLCSTPIVIEKESVKATGSGGTLYVGGGMFGSYSTIQEALDDATSGNTTIFVYNGTYQENIIINKTVNLTAEGPDAVIDGSGTGSVVTITADSVNLSGFTVQHCGDQEYSAGILLIADRCNISKTIIKDCCANGIQLENSTQTILQNNTFVNISISAILLWNMSSNNTVSRNSFTRCGYGIEVGNGSHDNTIEDNFFVNDSCGIFLRLNTTQNNLISNNIFNETVYGTMIEEAANNTITKNLYTRSTIGVRIITAGPALKNLIFHNTFINNTQQFSDECNQTWDNGYPSGGNYWDDANLTDIFHGPSQNISGADGLADTPYLQSENQTVDQYPLMQSWGTFYPVPIFTTSIDAKLASFNASASYDPDGVIVNWTWSFGDISAGYGEKINHTYLKDDAYNVSLKVIDDEGKNNTFSSYIVIGNDTQPPVITSVSNSPETVGFGFNVNISANVTDNFDVDIVLVNITYPNAWHDYFTMTHVTGNNYRYGFTDTWRNGKYNYTIWAVDHSNNSNSSNVFDFTVSNQATITVGTLKDMYGDNEYINITDPPNPPENLTVVGRGLTWNTYYNASSGSNILEAYQTPMNYQEDNGTWTPINNSFYTLPSNHPAYSYGYRTGNARGLFGVYFKPDITSNWPVAFAFNKSSNPSTDVIRSKLVGVGYLDPQSNWAYHYLQNVQNSQGQINGNMVNYPNVFTGTDVSWTYRNTELKEEITLSNTTKTLLQNHPPSMYGLNDASSYLVFITKLDYQNLNLYNTSGMLTENVTITDTGVDFKDALGCFKCALPLGDAYELNNVSRRQKLIYRIIHLNGNIYLLSGLKVSDVNAMMFPVVIDPTLSVNSLSNDGYIWKSDRVYNTAWSTPIGTVDSSSTYLSIGQKFSSSFYYIYRGFVLFNTSSLPWNAYLESAILSLYKKDDFSTTDFLLTIQNGQPVNPHNPLQAPDYNKILYSGNGGSLSTANFVNGRNNITLTNLNWVNRTGATKLCLRSSRDISGTTPTGNEYVNVYSANAPTVGYVPKLIITYRNQSKIKNIGSTKIKGFLLMQVQYYNTTNNNWVVDNDTVNEVTPRVINAREQIGLDTVFNGLINTWNLSHGNGLYRVYAAFLDPNGTVLQICGLALNASYEFSVTMNDDTDGDGWTDYEEVMIWHTDPLDDDMDNDGVPDSQDIDPLTNLQVTLTTKRVYASKYSYTWREAEDWDSSKTNTTEAGDSTEWLTIADDDASGEVYTRQNDSAGGFNKYTSCVEDNASWYFTVQKSGIYFFWMRCHRYDMSSSNVCLTWENNTGSYRIYDRTWDDGGLGYEVSWYSNTSNGWNWSWYGVLYLNEGDIGKLNLTNLNETTADYPRNLCGDLSGRRNLSYQWIEVDNILITDDPSCCPSGKGIENSHDTTIGYNIGYQFDQLPDNPYPDFYVKATIAGTTRYSYSPPYDVWWDTNDVLNDWTTTVDVSDQRGNENVPVTLELYDEDGANDFQVDISSDPIRKDCRLTYNLDNATWWGDDNLMDTDFLGRTSGEVDGYGPLDGNVIFEITQNDADNDHITYWQESRDGPFGNYPPVDIGTTNEKRAVIIGAGASCKLKQTDDAGIYSWQTSIYTGPHFVYEKGLNWDNYEVSVDLSTQEFYSLSNEQIGVMFRYQDESNYYLLRWQKRHLRDRLCLDKVVGGSLTSLGEAFWPLQRADWYTIRIKVDDNHIQVSINNNNNDYWWDMFDLQDPNGLSSGSIGLWCWKNQKAWFDDILVQDLEGHALLVDGFDYGKIFCWGPAGDITQTWLNTTRSCDQEDFYIQPDFVYRVLRLVGHYEPENILYLSAARWRDADGDGTNDVNDLSLKEPVRKASSTWLKESNRYSLNLVYIFDHGTYISSIDKSLFAIDGNRNGLAGGLSDDVFDDQVDRWLPIFTPTIGGNGRLTFVIEACYIGHFNQALAKPWQQRILISSSSYDTSAPPETGQDWPAFTHMLFSMLGSGSTNVCDAFCAADKHALTNYMSRWAPTYTVQYDGMKKVFVPRWVMQDGKLNDNGDRIDSDWFQGDDGFLSKHTGI